MRLFIAIDIPSELKGKIKLIRDEINTKNVDVKFVEPENLHLTLKFLGEVNEDHAKDIESAISDILKGTGPFKVNLEGIGFFGSPSYIRVIWVGLKEGHGEVTRLMEMLNERLGNIRNEALKPSPHLTIGRVRSGKNKDLLYKELIKMKDWKIGGIEVKEIKLKQSQLARGGPTYSDVFSCELV